MQHHDHNRDESVDGRDHAHININRFEISERTISIIALIMGAIAIGVLMIMPAYIEARVSAATAESVVTAKVARTDARMALDDVQRLREAMNAKGFNVQKEH